MSTNKNPTLYWRSVLYAWLVYLLLSPLAHAQKMAENFIYFPSRGADGITLRQDAALLDPRFSGAQVVYTWRELEPRKGHYDFSAIRQDLTYLNGQGKQLWVQLQEKSFTPKLNVPEYLVKAPQYKGGVLKQSMETAPERDRTQPLASDDYGWSAKLWEQTVRERYQRLIRALGNEFDGNITFINFS